MSENDLSPTIFVDVYRSKNRLRRGLWRWRAVAGNNRILASGEGFNRLADCLHSVQLLFGAETTVELRQLDRPNVVLRRP